MRTLTYYIDKGNENYEEFYTYSIPHIAEDEIYARQLFDFFVKDGKQYKLINTEMSETEEAIILEEVGDVKTYSDEQNFSNSGMGIIIEFRLYENFNYTNMPLLNKTNVQTHWHGIRYLLKDIVEVPGHGHMFMDSRELDEDRGCYVIYVTKNPPLK